MKTTPPSSGCTDCGNSHQHATWCPHEAMTDYPCRPARFPKPEAAEIARRLAEYRTLRPCEVYQCAEGHWHVQAVAA